MKPERGIVSDLKKDRFDGGLLFYPRKLLEVPPVDRPSANRFKLMRNSDETRGRALCVRPGPTKNLHAMEVYND